MFGLVAVVSSRGLAQSQAARPADGSAIGAWVGMARHSPGRPFGHSIGNDVAIGAMRLTHTLHASSSWTLDYTADVVPAAWISLPKPADPAIDRPCRPGESACEFIAPFSEEHVAYGLGTAPVGLQVRFAPYRRMQPLIGATGGALWFTRSVPTADAARFNFTGELGAGVLFIASKVLGLQLGYKLQHISNGGTRAVNPGIDSHMFYIGFVRLRGYGSPDST